MSITDLVQAQNPKDVLEQAEKLAIAIQDLKQKGKNFPVVATLKGDEVTSLLDSPVDEASNPITHGKDLVTAAKKYFEAHLRDQVANHPIIGEIKVSKKVSWHKTGGYAHGSLIHAKLIPAILDILAKGIFLGKEEPKTGRKDDAKQFFYLGAKVNLEGKIYTVSLSVIEYERGKFVYNLLEDPIGQLEGKLDALKKAVPVNPPSVSISTLDQRTALYDSSVDDDQTIFNIQILESVKNLEDSPLILEGRQNKVKTAKGTRLDTNLAIIEAADLIASHDALGNANPDYPAEIQPRDRSRQSSQQQIHNIANDLDPDSLGRSNRADSGAPIIGQDLVVESGNGRTIALKLAYSQGKAEEYREWILENAEYFGVDPEKVAQLKEPVLVRVRKTEVDRVQFAVEANQDDKLSSSATERAKTDAGRITGALLELFNPSDDGDFMAASNIKFIQGFLKSLGEHEAAQYTTTDGKPTQALVNRIKCAIFSKAYNDDRLLEMVADQTKPDLQNVLNALSLSAPKFIEAQAISGQVKGQLEDLSSQMVDGIEKSLDDLVINAILDATNVIEKAKLSNQAVTEYVEQLGLFGDLPEGVAELAVFISKNARSAKKLSLAFKAMAQFVERNATDSQNFGLFGEPEPVSIKDALVFANTVLSEQYGDTSQIAMFDSAHQEDTPVTAIDTMAHDAATSPLNAIPEPTEEQKLSGNYPKAKIQLYGLDISIENPAGSIRSGTDEKGNTWQSVMQHHYGFIENTQGADGDELDVFIKRGLTKLNNKIFVIYQVDPDTKVFDEHKLIIGADDVEEARQIYLSNYEAGWKGLESLHEINIEQLKAKLSKTWTAFDSAMPNINPGQVRDVYQEMMQQFPLISSPGLSPDSTPLDALKAIDAQARPIEALKLAAAALLADGVEPAFIQDNPIVLYTTKKGKVLEGIVLDPNLVKRKTEAQEYDPFTFYYDQSGWYVRLKHLATIPDNLLTPAQLNLKRDLTNATATSSDSHNLGQVRDGSGNPTSAHDGGSTAGSMAGQSGEGTSGGGNNGNSNPGVSELHAAGSGNGRDSSHAGQRKRRITSTGLATADSSTSNISSSSGSSTRSKRDRKIVQLAKSIRAELTGKALLQLEAEGTATEWGDLHSIQTALPYLSPEQQEDVLKAETHLFGKNANGMLFTNGTGTGKTFTGLGAVKRFVNAGLKNILIVSMNDKIVRDFVKSGVPLNLDIHQLDGITDNGGEEHNIVATTYANFAQNINLAKKKWDLIVVDESHNLMQSQDGNVTAALRKLRALSGHHDGFYDWYDDHFSEEMPPRETREERSVDDDGNVTVTQFADGPFIPGEATDKWMAKRSEEREIWHQNWREQPAGRTKVIFLSATPFSYVKSIEWAEGYLFDYTEPAKMWSSEHASEGLRYNSGNDRSKFFMLNFGYTMRYNKLNRPDGKIDSGVNERNFAEKLKTAGAMSGRELDVPFDYDRKFILIKSAAGQEIDRGLDILWESKNEADERIYSNLSRAVNSRFDYLSKERLLEAIKADAAIDQINLHLQLGRKIVVFHDYNEGGGFSPFKFTNKFKEDRNADQVQIEYDQFAQEHPDLVALDLQFPSPIQMIKAHFPDVLLFNGRVSKAERAKNADLFNTDNSGRDVIMVQSDAGATGISFHDTTGVHQRVIINLGLPKRPAKLRQTEGRIYRFGQASNAIQRYLTTGTKWETSAFANVIAQRAETVDNLAKGDDAVVSIRDAIISAYNAAEYSEPSLLDGIGGKAYDEENARIARLSAFDKAKTYYYNKGKNRDNRANKIGKDWYATPEPLGMKMVEWSGAHNGDDVLEPSAGDGAIGRWFPNDTNTTMIEPSSELASRAQLSSPNANVVMGSFESHNTMIKYDAIVMNPPFGHAGSLALEHLKKACAHLREGGRVVALVPNSPNLDKGLEKWQAQEGQEFYTVASINLPASTFSNANTSVSTRIIILERHALPEDAPYMRNIDLSYVASVEELFEKIEHLGFNPRKLRQDEALLEYGLILSPYRNSHILSGIGIQDPAIREALLANRFVYTVTNDPDSLECAARNIKSVLASLKEAGVSKIQENLVHAFDSWKHDGMFDRIGVDQIKVDLKKYVRLEKKPTMKTPIVVVKEGHDYRLIVGYERYKLAMKVKEHFIPAIVTDKAEGISREAIIEAYKKTPHQLDPEVFANNLYEVLDDLAELSLAG